ncbi:hypothetical protein Pmar_PMAR014536 [Perkinsus marinus ATCC 50983]|uniref:Uncharacterized protein n=1 Tax=Perkinsus marinus (strain ATCC 50983 / TXsc) TaxID=423536 RepID=C5KWC4_PERM5|nr:hypothetical protein Pmar_PMAR014536 [Perkinsus marinus ATCC 50983]EER11235.1 hypothetical protein Pmar_PMAR014536 [Perkinsus marinus ATCC 50983]|eukprot:XP_002779440.1 hypothetical protein Pmar_PMAR014536 [Perkinsus marinus ATCC 50983]
MVFTGNTLSGGMCFGSRYGIECNEFGFRLINADGDKYLTAEQYNEKMVTPGE